MPENCCTFIAYLVYFYDNGLCLDFWHFLDINDWLVLGWQTFDKLEKQTKIFQFSDSPTLVIVKFLTVFKNSNMANALTLLRQFTIDGKHIEEREDHIIFGEFSWKKDSLTNFVKYS